MGSMPEHIKPAAAPLQTPIAVVGMACRLPGGNKTPQALWEFLGRGGVAKNTPPTTHWNAASHFDGSGRPGTLATPGIMALEDCDLAAFDAPFFSLGPIDATSMDPQQRMLLEVTYECLENSGVTLDSIRGQRVGCIAASISSDYEGGLIRDPEDVVVGRATGTSRAILSNRISHFLDINGPSITIDTACSSGLIGVDMACRYLQMDDASAVIVAGVLLWFDPFSISDKGAMKGAFSDSGRCHTFDAKADGYCRAEGVNAVYLKRLDHAVRDGDPIRAVIRGTAATADGRTPGITHPNDKAQAMAIRSAYRNAGIPESDLRLTGYLECHGTGTPTGDKNELQGVSSVFAPHREPDNPLVIGSVKSNIGHSEAAAGLSGLIKAVMAVESGVIPGNPTFVTPNPAIDFVKGRVRPTRTSLRWPKGTARRASVNSFGFGGANAHAVIEESSSFLAERHVDLTAGFVSSYKAGSVNYSCPGLSAKVPARVATNGHTNGVVSTHTSPQQQLYLIPFSGNDKDSLDKNMSALSAHLINPAVSVNLRDLAFTLAQRRTHHFHRSFALVDSVDSLTFIDANTAPTGRKRAQPPRVAFVFTGQGAQWVGMGRALIEAYPLARRTVESMDEALAELPEGVRPSWSVLDNLVRTDLDPAELRRPELSQPLTTALQLALLAVIQGFGLQADKVVGHSSGEMAAAAAAGLISARDAIKVAYFRGLAAKECPPERRLGMLAVGLAPEQAEPYLADAEDGGSEVQIACYNAPRSVTISGPVDALEKVKGRIQADGHFARLLQVDLAYHSRYMEDIASRFVSLSREHCLPTPQGTQQTSASSQVPTGVSTGVSMYSSVTGQLLNKEQEAHLTSGGPEYWHSNLVNPVRFSQAASALLSGKDAPDFVVEIGPSNALAGPMAQILQSLQPQAQQQQQQVQYLSAAKRGPDALRSLLDVAGRLWTVGAAVDLSSVNKTKAAAATEQQQQLLPPPSIIIDLPNYQWNHSQRYWSQTLPARELRFRPFISHDLLGTKIGGTSWSSCPSWSKIIRLEEVPWLRGHVIADQVIFPAAGYLAMAMEAAYQAHYMTAWDVGARAPESFLYRLKDVNLMRVLPLEENVGSRVMLTLSTLEGSPTPWKSFKVLSRQDGGVNSPTAEGTWVVHCEGLVRIDEDLERRPRAPPGVAEPLVFPDPGSKVYEDLDDTGYHYGPDFQRIRRFESHLGRRRLRADVSMDDPASSVSPYPVHPVVVDSFIQVNGFPLRHFLGERLNEVVAVPVWIGDMTVAPLPRGKKQRGQCVAYMEARYRGSGSREKVFNYEAYGGVYDPEDDTVVLEMRDVRRGVIEAREDPSSNHVFTYFRWDADLTLSGAEPLAALLPSSSFSPSSASPSSTTPSATDDAAEKIKGEGVAPMAKRLQRILDLASHQKPTLSVLEVNVDPEDASCSWLERTAADESASDLEASQAASQTRGMFSKYLCVSSGTKAVLEMEKTHKKTAGSGKRIAFELSNLGGESDTGITSQGQDRFDLAIVKLPRPETIDSKQVEVVLAKARRALATQGQLLIVTTESDGLGSLGLDQLQQEDGGVLKALGFNSVKDLSGTAGTLADTGEAQQGLVLASLPHSIRDPPPGRPEITCLQFTSQPEAELLISRLRELGWDVKMHASSPDVPLSIPRNSNVLVLDEIWTSLLAAATAEHWDALQSLVRAECNLLWVTAGALMDVTRPDGAVSQGLMRVIRNEEAHLRVCGLDVGEGEDGALTAAAVARALELLTANGDAGVGEDRFRGECELVHRGGVFYTQRLLPETELNRANKEHLTGRPAQDRALLASAAATATTTSGTIRLRAERVGIIESLAYSELDDGPSPPLPEGWVEVEIRAAGLNFKDVAVAMGLVSADEKTLGADAAGVITRVGGWSRSGVEGSEAEGANSDHRRQLRPGQRVVLTWPGVLANRVLAPVPSVRVIPDSMTFEEAASLPIPYLTSLYCLFDLAGLQRGQKVLVHSAAGGVGNAALQICRYMDAEIFATVGSDEKRAFIRENFGIPDSHIFSSRNVDFAEGIMRLTDGYGVDVILNSLTGELLDASWNIIAKQGTMVEIGKRDIGAHNRLSMDPFARSASFRAMELENTDRWLLIVPRLFDQLFTLIEQGHLKPLFPLHTFGFDEAIDAFRSLQSGKMMGKFILTHGKGDKPVVVPVRPPPRTTLRLRPDVCYLVVGGIKGLCGTLAIDLAKHGARHLAVLSRGGCDDENSRFIIFQAENLGCRVDVVRGDVTVLEDVRRVFAEIKAPVAGIIHGAMVIKDRTFVTTTLDDYHAVLGCKVKGNWNLHQVTQELGLKLDFYTMISSIASVFGSKSQTAYATANAFMDALAAHRTGQLGLPACAINLGMVEDSGYLATAQGQELLGRIRNDALVNIKEGVLCRVGRLAILQQQEGKPISPASAARIVTGVAVPQPPDSLTRFDNRFGALLFVPEGAGSGGGGRDSSGSGGGDGRYSSLGSLSQDAAELRLLLKSRAEQGSAAVVAAAVALLSRFLARLLRMSDAGAVDAERPLSAYGLDSLAGVEFRNWIRGELGVSLATGDITSSPSLLALCEVVVAKGSGGAGAGVSS